MPRFSRQAIVLGLCAFAGIVTLLGLAAPSLGSGKIVWPNMPLQSTGRKSGDGASHLVMVPGHAIWAGSGSQQGDHESEWFLSEFQKGETRTYIKHIEVAAEIARKDLNAVLVLSGGQTNEAAGPLSEGQSYWALARARGELIQDTSGASLAGRMVAEEYARDSYENLVFSIARFHEYTGHYPTQITVVGHNFKRHRFEQLHRQAILFPEDQFEYVGIDPDRLERDVLLMEKVEQAERENAIKPFEADPHGCSHKLLVEKRKQRNPFRRSHPYGGSCPEMADLLAACNAGSGSSVQLPWYTAPNESETANSTAIENA